MNRAGLIYTTGRRGNNEMNFGEVLEQWWSEYGEKHQARFPPTHNQPAETHSETPKGSGEWSLAELLDNLKTEHDRFQLKDVGAGLRTSDRRALLRQGPYLVPGEVIRFRNIDGERVHFDEVHGDAPIMMFVGVRHTRAYDPDLPTAVWALKIPPPTVGWVERTPGIYYYVGLIWELDKGREFSARGVCSVDFARHEVHVPRMKRNEAVHIQPRGDRWRRSRGGSIIGRYSQSAWGIDTSMYRCTKRGHGDVADAEGKSVELIKSAFLSALMHWRERDSYYQVATRRAGTRVTVCVPAGRHIAFFRDRDRSAIDRNGKRKKIVHYVKAHERINGQRVKAHLRGIRHFHWQGYDVSIAVPSSHVVDYTFDVDPIWSDDPLAASTPTLGAATVARKIAALQDTKQYRHGQITEAERGWKAAR